MIRSALKMLLYYSCLAVLLFCSDVFSYLINRRIIRQSGNDSNSCTTPDSQSGYCINLRNCSHLHGQLKTVPLKPELTIFLQKSLCGKDVDRSPKVCCSFSNTANILVTSPSVVETTPSLPITSTLESRLFTSRNTNYSVCGKTKRDTWKIIGGQNASLGDWPWMVALGYRSPADPDPSFRCGGSLISDRWVVTAAHCVLNIGKLNLTIARIGDLNLDDDVDDGASPINIPVEKIIPHPGYTTKPIANDIALLGLKNPVTLTARIRPICIPNKDKYGNDEFYSNKSPFVIGWGSTEWRGSISSMLQEVQLNIVDRVECAAQYENQTSSNIDHRVLCAAKKRRDSCQGDSGGPLMMPIKSSYYLIGVVSFGIGCGNRKYSGVYTRVAQFSDWIGNTTGIEVSD